MLLNNACCRPTMPLNFEHAIHGHSCCQAAAVQPRVGVPGLADSESSTCATSRTQAQCMDQEALNEESSSNKTHKPDTISCPQDASDMHRETYRLLKEEISRGGLQTEVVLVLLTCIMLPLPIANVMKHICMVVQQLHAVTCSSPISSSLVCMRRTSWMSLQSSTRAQAGAQSQCYPMLPS